MLDHAAENGKSGQPKDDRISVRLKFAARFPTENGTQTKVLAVICDIVNADDNTAYLSKPLLAKRARISRAGLYRAVRRLEQLGALTTEDVDSTTRWYLPPLKEMRAFAQDIRAQDKAERDARIAAKRPHLAEEMRRESPAQANGQSQNETAQSQNETAQSQNENLSLTSDTLFRSSSGETSGLLSGDGKAGDSASPPDKIQDPFSFHETLEDPKAKTKTKAGTVLNPEVLPPLSVGDEEAAKSRHYDVTSPTQRPRRVERILTAKEKRDARQEAEIDAEVQRWEAEERANAGRKTA
jgi:hypothetical protein